MKYLLMGLTLLSLFTSCMTAEQRTEEALGAARNKATNELRELNEIQVAFVKFTPPEMQQMPLFNYERAGEKGTFYSEAFSTRPAGFDRTEKRPIRNRHFLTGFIWFLPDTNEIVVVTGVSDAELSDWTPLKVAHRPIIPAHPRKNEILKQAREASLSRAEPYLGNEMLEMNLRNKIRFEAPEVYRQKSDDLKHALTLIWRNDSDTQMGVHIIGNTNAQLGQFKIEKINYTAVPTDFSKFEKVGQFGEKKSILIKDYQ